VHNFISRTTDLYFFADEHATKDVRHCGTKPVLIKKTCLDRKVKGSVTTGNQAMFSGITINPITLGRGSNSLVGV
jgi:hypothetical protein